MGVPDVQMGPEGSAMSRVLGEGAHCQLDSGEIDETAAIGSVRRERAASRSGGRRRRDGGSPRLTGRGSAFHRLTALTCDPEAVLTAGRWLQAASGWWTEVGEQLDQLLKASRQSRPVRRFL